MSRADDAKSCFDRGFNCAQSVLYVFCDEYGMSKEEALKVSCAFGGGMGRTGCTCGAVSGACMALGLKYGMYREGDQDAKEKTYALAGEFARRFKASNGSLMCTELLGCDLGTPEGMKAMKEQNLHKTKCTKYVRDAAEIAADLLDRRE
jgi:C_GCAxxG_C_C family probable redox protein